MMKIDQKNRVHDYLEKIRAATHDKSILWVEVNPTTYVWLTDVEDARVVLQKLTGVPSVESGRLTRINDYMLQAADKTGQIQFSVKGSDDILINDHLSKLFSEIEELKASDSLDFLETILPQKSKM